MMTMLGHEICQHLHVIRALTISMVVFQMFDFSQGSTLDPAGGS